MSAHAQNVQNISHGPQCIFKPNSGNISLNPQCIFKQKNGNILLNFYFSVNLHKTKSSILLHKTVKKIVKFFLLHFFAIFSYFFVDLRTRVVLCGYLDLPVCMTERNKPERNKITKIVRRNENKNEVS